jgi:hypothetical protein
VGKTTGGGALLRCRGGEGVVWRKGNALTRGTGRSVKERREGGEAGHRACFGRKKGRVGGIKLGRGENLGRLKRKGRGRAGLLG